MKVILIQNVEKLGIVGDRKEVKDGFARNYLFPKKLAVKHGDPKVKEIIKKAKEQRETIIKGIGSLKEKAKELSGKTVKIKAKVGEKGQLFSSISADDLAKEIKMDKKNIEMNPIKSVGLHEVVVKFGHGVETNLKIEVEKEAEKKKSTVK